ncbi:MAG TPA: tripartite tricarboxylate transporter substrate-binding protein [Xanthobacteraceae bacterium]|nr:tripartite tricarboxylate transporter substrate-binding protein [Xanthobacteraceae bacterium]
MPIVKFAARAASCIVGAALFAVASGGTVRAQSDFPNKPIRLIVPFAPGGLADITMRIVGEKLGERLGQRIIIDNRPSGGGIAAAQAVATAPPDGYTLIVFTNGTAISVNLFKSLPFDPVKDFVPVSSVAYFDILLLVNGSSPIKTVNDLLAKARGGQINIGTINPGSTQNLSAELFKATAGIDANIIPFKSSPEVQTALVRDDIVVGFESYAALKGAIDDKMIRAIATSGTSRSLTDIPTVLESSPLKYEVVGWNAIFAPGGTPRDVVAKLNKEIVEIMALPDIKKRILELGTEPKSSTPEEIAARLKADIAKWGGVIERAKIEKR